LLVVDRSVRVTYRFSFVSKRTARVPLRCRRSRLSQRTRRRLQVTCRRQLVRHDWLRHRLSQTIEIQRDDQQGNHRNASFWCVVLRSSSDITPFVFNFVCRCSGEIERLRRFWFTGETSFELTTKTAIDRLGACKSNVDQQSQRSSQKLDVRRYSSMLTYECRRTSFVH
jgi:hypothetical protein